MKCCNPECQAPFDYREGRLIRLSKSSSYGDPSGKQSSVRHFWLCRKCAPLYTFECDSAMNVQLKRRNEPSKDRLARSASVA